MKFLSHNGLMYFYEKIKTQLNTKTDVGHKHNASDIQTSSYYNFVTADEKSKINSMSGKFQTLWTGCSTDPGFILIPDSALFNSGRSFILLINAYNTMETKTLQSRYVATTRTMIVGINTGIFNDDEANSPYHNGLYSFAGVTLYNEVSGQNFCNIVIETIRNGSNTSIAIRSIVDRVNNYINSTKKTYITSISALCK